MIDGRHCAVDSITGMAAGKSTSKRGNAQPTVRGLRHNVLIVGRLQRFLLARKAIYAIAMLSLMAVARCTTSATLLPSDTSSVREDAALKLHMQPAQHKSVGVDNRKSTDAVTSTPKGPLADPPTGRLRRKPLTDETPATLMTPMTNQTSQATPHIGVSTVVVGPRTRHEAFDQSVSRERGIVISLHDDVVPLGLSLIKDLRCMGNNELIQVYHCFPDELSAESRELLLMNETRLEIVDACTFYTENGTLSSHVAHSFRSWWLKPLALVHTDLREVILLDADVIPMRDPAVLRSVSGYVRTGTTFFYDRVIPGNLYFNANVGGRQGLQAWIDTFDYGAFNLTGPAPSTHLLQSLAYNRQTCHEMDSSMVAVDKTRAGKAIDVLWFLITKKRLSYNFSWGDKEAFWLAYEFAHVEYAFSPWGVSVVSSYPNRDMEDHPNTLCGSLAHFMPVEEDTPELLYVNGKALIDPFPQGIDGSRTANKNLLYNLLPTHVTPRHVRALTPALTGTSFTAQQRKRSFYQECLVDMGSTPLPLSFQQQLLRRRTSYLGIRMGVYSALSKCAAF